jgi:hypothetical protein
LGQAGDEAGPNRIAQLVEVDGDAARS